MKKVFELEWDEKLLLYRDSFLQEALTAFYGEMFKVKELPSPLKSGYHDVEEFYKDDEKTELPEELKSGWIKINDWESIGKRFRDIADKVNDIIHYLKAKED